MEEENYKVEKDLEQRKKKFIEFIKQPKVWVIFFLIIALILGIYIRSLPMTNRMPDGAPPNLFEWISPPSNAGTPGLWDITTNTWALGPDLDPWLFLRQTKIIIEEGKLPKIDIMRNVPLGFDNARETVILPYLIDWTYHLSKMFYSETTPEFAGALFPVIMFAFTIIAFFLFVREVFIKNSKESKIKANIIALISTFIMIVTPIFLSRTIAGIPEKESAAFFFIFLAFYLFLKAWKSEKTKTAITFGIFAGIATAAIGLVWGGAQLAYATISISALIAFILNKINKKEFITYTFWGLTTFLTLIIIPNKLTIRAIFTSLSTGLIIVVFFIMLIHFLLWKTKLSQNKYLQKIKLPKNIISFILALILLIIMVTIIFGQSFIIQQIKEIHQTIFKPIMGRWNTTVAENRQPYFTEWRTSFGPFLKNIPLMFWSFVIGSIILFKQMLKHIKKKDSWILTGSFILVLLGMTFSRYSSSSILNGENFISKLIYYGAVFLFLFLFIKIYTKYSKENNKSFENIEYEYVFLLILLLISIFSARGAVRLIMVLGPIAPIFLAYITYESTSKLFSAKKETTKIVYAIFSIILILICLFIFWTYFEEVKAQSYNMVPSYYNQQWQKAMDWTRENTSEDAVFGHWWDYGYWVQSIGERATVLDGGNAISFWNYWMGRLVLTGDNQKDALEFLYAHNTTHFLIDSSDIGKYGAFSSIGSNENYDRLSWIGTMLLDEKQTQETNNKTIYIYTGGIGLDEDLIIEQNNEQIFLPAGQTGIGGILLPFKKTEQGEQPDQPQAIMIYQNKQYSIPLKYLSINQQFYEFETGIEATIFVFPELIPQGQGISTNQIGAAMFISPRLMRGMLSQVYILNDPLNNFPNFNLVHTETNLIIENLNQQGLNLPEFVYYQGIQGPIKIWEIKYPEGFSINEETKQKYLDTDPRKYLNWQL